MLYFSASYSSKSTKQFIFLLAVVIASLIIISPNANAATYYADYETGNDSNNGTSQSTPWRDSPGMVGATGIAASTILQPGDTVYFKKGVTWPSAAMPLTPTLGQSGTSGSPITYMAKSDWGTGTYAIFDAEGSHSYVIDMFSGSGRQYLIFDGFWMRNSMSSAYYDNNNPNNIFRNFKVTGSSGPGSGTAAFYSGAKTTVENCIVDANQADWGIELDWQSGHVVRGCDVSNAGQGGIRFAANSNNGIIEKNYVHNISTSRAWGIVYRSSDYGTIRYNVIDVRGQRMPEA